MTDKQIFDSLSGMKDQVICTILISAYYNGFTKAKFATDNAYFYIKRTEPNVITSRNISIFKRGMMDYMGKVMLSKDDVLKILFRLPGKITACQLESKFLINSMRDYKLNEFFDHEDIFHNV